MKKVALLPSLLTLGNAALGFTAIVTVLDAAFAGAPNKVDPGKLQIAIYCIFGAMLCDALDGTVAHLVKGTTEFGGYLDSLADMVSFGIAPALIVKAIVKFDFHLFEGYNWNPWSKITWLVTGIYCLGTILRLARFNVESKPDHESHQFFDGLPCPPAAGVLVAVALLYIVEPVLRDVTFYTMLISAPFLALMMVSRIRYSHLINRVLLGERSFAYLVLFAGALVAVFTLGIYIYALAAGFLAYALWGLIAAILRKKRKGPQTPEPSDERVIINTH